MFRFAALIFANCYASVQSQALYTSVVSYLSGSQQGYADGPATSSRFNFPYHMDMFNDGQHVLVADSYNAVIRKVNILTGESTTILGTRGNFGNVDAVGTSALFRYPLAMVLSNDESYAFITDFNLQ